MEVDGGGGLVIGPFRTVGHENDSSPTIFEIFGSFIGGVFSVLHGVSVVCVLES